MVDLGLLEERLTLPPPPWAGRAAGHDLAPSRPPVRGGKPGQKAKNRRRAEKEARRRNRRK